jgi:hypothetical protein
MMSKGIEINLDFIKEIYYLCQMKLIAIFLILLILYLPILVKSRGHHSITQNVTIIYPTPVEFPDNHNPEEREFPLNTMDEQVVYSNEAIGGHWV